MCTFFLRALSVITLEKSMVYIQYLFQDTFRKPQKPCFSSFRPQPSQLSFQQPFSAFLTSSEPSTFFVDSQKGLSKPFEDLGWINPSLNTSEGF